MPASCGLNHRFRNHPQYDKPNSLLARTAKGLLLDKPFGSRGLPRETNHAQPQNRGEAASERFPFLRSLAIWRTGHPMAGSSYTSDMAVDAVVATEGAVTTPPPLSGEQAADGAGETDRRFESESAIWCFRSNIIALNPCLSICP